MNDEASGALARVARGIGGTQVIDRLAALSGSDFASVMLEVVRRRADRETPASVLRRAQRFPVGWHAHFSLFAMVTAGRDEGSRRFEQAALAGQLRFAVAGLAAAG